MNEANRVFDYLTNWELGDKPISKMQNLLLTPTNMRLAIIQLIENEIKNANKKKPAKIIIKLNSLTDPILLSYLYKAVKANVEVHLIIRGILTLKLNSEKNNQKLNAISIVDQYLEHARVMIFHNKGNEKVFISSADWMVRNLDHRIEVATPIFDNAIKKELIDLLDEKRWNDIKKLTWRVGLMNLAGILVLSHGLWLYPNWITSHFTQDSETIRLTLETMKIILPAMIIYSFTSIMLAVVEGTGSTMAGFWIEVITSIIYAISVYMMVKFTTWEVPILWLADYLYFIILGICSITFLKYGKWKHKMI